MSRIDVRGHDMMATLAKEQRRQAELRQAAGLDEVAAMLLPLSLALARLTARTGEAVR